MGATREGARKAREISSIMAMDIKQMLDNSLYIYAECTPPDAINISGPGRRSYEICGELTTQLFN